MREYKIEMNKLLGNLMMQSDYFIPYRFYLGLPETWWCLCCYNWHFDGLNFI